MESMAPAIAILLVYLGTLLVFLSTGSERQYTERQILSRFALFLLFWLVLGIGFLLGIVFMEVA